MVFLPCSWSLLLLLDWLARWDPPSHSSVLCLQIHSLSFYLSHGDLNPGPHAYAASTLPTEPSSQLPFSFFLYSSPSDSYAHYYRCQKKRPETSKLTPHKKSIFVKSKETTKGLCEAQEEYSDVRDCLIQIEGFENSFQTSAKASVSLGNVLLSMMHRE